MGEERGGVRGREKEIPEMESFAKSVKSVKCLIKGFKNQSRISYLSHRCKTRLFNAVGSQHLSVTSSSNICFVYRARTAV